MTHKGWRVVKPQHTNSVKGLDHLRLSKITNIIEHQGPGLDFMNA